MKHIAVAFIVIALIAADFGSDIWMDGTDNNRAWALADTAALVAAIFWFWHHRDAS